MLGLVYRNHCGNATTGEEIEFLTLRTVGFTRDQSGGGRVHGG